MSTLKDPAGNPAPPGGFKTGGWYSGYQYWNGGFAPKAGQINPQSNQQGAGQMVSNEVIAQTNPQNVAYIQQQNQQQPNTKDEVTPYLNNYQKSLLASSEAPETRNPVSLSELKTELAPSAKYPTPLNRMQKFQELRQEQGVTQLEQQLNDLKAQQQELDAQFQQQKNAERGKTVPMNVIQGRVGQEEQQYLERKDYLSRQMARVTDQLNTKYNIISTYMNLMGLDYNDAVKQYESEFDRNVQLYNLVQSAYKQKRSEYESDRAAASANLQIYYNALTSGKMDYSSLPPDQKLMVQKLEMQAGLPMGFVASLHMSPSDKILQFNSKTGEVLMTDNSGHFKVVQTGMRPSPRATTQTEKNQYYTSTAQEDAHNGVTLRKMLQIYRGYLDPNDVYSIYNNNSPHGSAKESPEELAKLGITVKTTNTSIYR